MSPRSRLLLLLLALACLAAAGRGYAQSPNRAGLVVQFGDGAVYSACVEFSEPTISGWELLQRAGLAAVPSDYGLSDFALCKLGDGTRADGCDYPRQDCFCQCQTPANCRYWAYHHLVEGEWRYAGVGASSRRVRNGDVDGWGWGLGRIDTSGVEPPLIPFAKLCPAGVAVAPTPAPASGLLDALPGRLSSLVGFALLAAGLVAAGLWALLRQRGG